MIKTTVLILALAAASPAFAQTSASASASTRFGALRSTPDPYRTLFQPNPYRQTIQPRQGAAPATPPKPTVVCGMTVIPADPTIDSKMLLTPKADGVEHKIRTIAPTICTPAR